MRPAKAGTQMDKGVRKHTPTNPPTRILPHNVSTKRGQTKIKMADKNGRLQKGV
jgi:hypothetical protein